MSGRSPENIASDLPYEGQAFPVDGRAAILARVMHRVTNRLFLEMSEIWSGRKKEPDDAPQKYARLNDLLVHWFETILTALETGEPFPGDKEACFLADAERKIAGVLQR